MVIVEISGKLPVGISRSLVSRLAEICRKLSGFSGCPAVSLSVVADTEIRRLNRQFRGIDKVTDVLSFGYRPESGFSDSTPPHNSIPLGDIVISAAQMKRQAAAIGRPANQEFCLLFAHGLLHLFGFDHDTAGKEKVMFALQQEALMRAGVL
jgi:probable rRNA maturation factor